MAERAGRSNSRFKREKKSDVSKHVRSKMKQDGMNAEEALAAMEISPPTDVEHKLRVRFDQDNIRFSGIPKEWTEEAHKQFGVPLAQCPRMDVPGYAERIPVVLVLLRNRLVEMKGLKSDGIFRLAPDGSESSSVKTDLNAGKAMESLQTTLDANVVANLIKQFYRELKPNLLNSMDRDTIFRWSELKKDEELEIAIEAIREPEQSALLWLLDLLADTAEHVEVNRMTPKNLAIVLAPNLYDCGDDASPMEALVVAQKVATLTVNILNYRIKTRPPLQK